MSNRTLYLAGPMTGYIDSNFPLFLQVGEKLRHLGFNVISPAELDLEAGLDPRGLSLRELEELFTPQKMREVIRRDIDAILQLRPENGDFIATLPYWEASRGVGAEVYMGRWAGLGIYNVGLSPATDLVLMKIDLAPVDWIPSTVQDLWPDSPFASMKRQGGCGCSSTGGTCGR